MVDPTKKRWPIILTVLLIVAAFRYYFACPFPPEVPVPNLGVGSFAYAYLFGSAPVALEIDYEEGCNPDRDAVNYLISAFNQVSHRVLLSDPSSWNEIALWDFNVTGIGEHRDSPNDISHIYILYNDEDSLQIGKYGYGGYAWDASTILMSDPNATSPIREANRLLHELGHLLALFHPPSAPNLHPVEADYCVMSTPTNNTSLQFFCPYCLFQLSRPKSVLFNMQHWLLEANNISTPEWRQGYRTLSRNLALVYLLAPFLPFLGLMTCILYLLRKERSRHRSRRRKLPPQSLPPTTPIGDGPPGASNLGANPEQTVIH